MGEHAIFKIHPPFTSEVKHVMLCDNNLHYGVEIQKQAIILSCKYTSTIEGRLNFLQYFFLEYYCNNTVYLFVLTNISIT